ncbi:MAG TPA: LysR family transcriptional regulator [Candidatus Dormibacteraeota bacterium]|jgi:DNA-binding transcriptional LysR family regulator|nr:LysR family transcriptional regulator [Candidatus Dormibacteraeota bacterium]
MTFVQLRVFVAVVERGGFTAAAEHLEMAQPSVSRAVGALESELGARLLTRGKDGVQPTEAGRAAFTHGREVLRRQDLLLAEVAAAAGRVSGVLRLASFQSVTAGLLPERLRALVARHPQVEVRLFDGTDHEVLAWVEQGAAEIGVVTLPCGSLETVSLAEDEMVAVLPAGHLLAAAPSVTMEALADEPFILSTGGCEPIITAAARAAGVRLRPSYEAREVATILAMVTAGLGVSIVPTLALPPFPEGAVARPLDPKVRRSLALAARSLTDLSPAARAFLEAAAEAPPSRGDQPR